MRFKCCGSSHGQGPKPGDGDARGPCGDDTPLCWPAGVDAILEPPLPTEGFEAQCPVTWLPAIPSCELTPARLSGVPYLCAEDDAVQRWAPTFADRSVVHVGLHWRADVAHVAGQQRSLRLSDLAPLFEIAGARFYSVQDNGGDELKAYPEVADLGHVDHPGARFVETPAVMKHLDLLIACDSGPAHVAGALGCPVWLLLVCRGKSAGACSARRHGIQGIRSSGNVPPATCRIGMSPSGGLRSA